LSELPEGKVAHSKTCYVKAIKSQNASGQSWMDDAKDRNSPSSLQILLEWITNPINYSNFMKDTADPNNLTKTKLKYCEEISQKCTRSEEGSVSITVLMPSNRKLRVHKASDFAKSNWSRNSRE
jgi:hypothetical protein